MDKLMLRVEDCLRRAETDLRHWYKNWRRRRHPRKWTILLAQLALFSVLVLVSIWIYIHYSPNRRQMHWTFALAGMVASSVGVVFSLIAAWRASAADKKTAFLLRELQETQRIVQESPTDYNDIFDIHLLRPMTRAANPHGKEDHLRRMDLHISTPAYGYHVLGYDQHSEFRRLLDTLKCDKQIILFSPDAHFFHVANTLLWHPLSEPHLDGTGARDLNQVQETQGQVDYSNVNSKALAVCIIATMGIMQQQVFETEQNVWRKNTGELSNMNVGVWTSNTTEFRLTAFRFEKETLAFLLLTDQVTLASNLARFQGRALSLPVSLHRQVVGDPRDQESFFEQLKTCPYSAECRGDAHLTSGELEMLKYDYLFLRTGHTIIDLYSFNIQCREVIWSARKPTPAKEAERIAAAREILQGVVQYFIFLKRLKIASDYVPANSIQQKRLLQLEGVAQLASDQNITATQVLYVLRDEKNAPHDRDSFRREVTEYEERIKDFGADFIELSNWIACIYYFLSSGIRESLFADGRRKRAQHLKPLAEVEINSAQGSAISRGSAQPSNGPKLFEPESATSIIHTEEEQSDQERATANAPNSSNRLETEGDSDDESQALDT